MKRLSLETTHLVLYRHTQYHAVDFFIDKQGKFSYIPNSEKRVFVRQIPRYQTLAVGYRS
jgi:hypothetical protein